MFFLTKLSTALRAAVVAKPTIQHISPLISLVSAL